MEECQVLMKNMLQNTLIILQRPDPLERKKIKESWIGFGIELDRLNSETREILEDKSWRNAS